MNIRFWLAGFVVLTSFSAARQGTSAPLPDETVVVRAGVERITRGELIQHLLTYYGRNAVEEMINRSVVRQETTARKISLTEAEVDARVGEIKKASGSDVEEALRKGDLTEIALREQAKHALLAEKLLDAKWPVKPSDLVRYSAEYAHIQNLQEAKRVISDAKRGVSFAVLGGQSGGGESGQVQPDPFLRIDSPAFFRAIADANLRPGQVSSQPTQTGNTWLVLKLDKVYAADTLTGLKRDAAVKRIRAARYPSLIPASRKRYRIATVTSVDDLLRDPKMSGDTVVTRVGMEPVTRKELVGYLLELYAKAGLEQLIERKLVHQEALQSGVSISPAEVEDRLASARKGDEKAYQTALTTEGISEDALRERVRFSMLAEKVVATRVPLGPSDLERLAVRYIRLATKQDAEQVIQAARGGHEVRAVGRAAITRSRRRWVHPTQTILADRESRDLQGGGQAVPGRRAGCAHRVGRHLFCIEAGGSFRSGYHDR